MRFELFNKVLLSCGRNAGDFCRRALSCGEVVARVT